jgi:hypothetical protein
MLISPPAAAVGPLINLSSPNTSAGGRRTFGRACFRVAVPGSVAAAMAVGFSSVGESIRPHRWGSGGFVLSNRNTETVADQFGAGGFDIRPLIALSPGTSFIDSSGRLGICAPLPSPGKRGNPPYASPIAHEIVLVASGGGPCQHYSSASRGAPRWAPQPPPAWRPTRGWGVETIACAAHSLVAQAGRLAEAGPNGPTGLPEVVPLGMAVST